MSLSKVWGAWLLVGQLGNALLGALSTVLAVPATDGPLALWKAKALVIHATVAAVLGVMQAFAKGLADADGDGVPDVFQPKPPAS